MNSKETLKTLIEFWDSALKLSQDDKDDIKASMTNDNYLDFAPSKKLADALDNLLTANKVLDYGCGNAWASLILAKKGAKHVKAVDTSKEGIESAKFILDTYDVSNKVDLEVIDESWLEKQAPNSYDGLICSNVLDVLPLDVSKQIIVNFHNILKKDALLVVGLNFYADPKIKPLEEGKYIYLDGVLRLLSLSDDEWKGLFEPYFEIVYRDYFAWPGENIERRRLFVLKNK